MNNGTIPLVSAMITPAILILACGSLIASAYSRYGRLFDRARKLSLEVTEGHYTGAMNPEKAYDWLGRYEKRLVCVRLALISFFTAVTFFVATSLSIALANKDADFIYAPAILAILGATALLIGAALMLSEALQGGYQVLDEIEGAREKLRKQLKMP